MEVNSIGRKLENGFRGLIGSANERDRDIILIVHSEMIRHIIKHITNDASMISHRMKEA